MKIKHIALQSVAIAALTLAGCADDNLQPPSQTAPQVSITVATLDNGRISRAETPVQEKGDPNESYIHSVAVIITTRPINSGEGEVVKVLQYSGISDDDNISVDTREANLYWYDSEGVAHSVYSSDQTADNTGYRSTICNKVTLSQGLADEIENLAANSANGEETWLYATAVANVDITKFKDAGSATPVTIAQGMTVARLRDLIYTGDLCRSNFGYFPYDPASTSSTFPWGPTGYPGGEVRFSDFAMSSVNEVKFQPKFDSQGRFTMPTLMVQRMAARVDIAFGVQAVTRYSAAERNNDYDRTSIPYITDRGWFYTADTDATNHKTGPGNTVDAPFEHDFGAGFVGLVDITPDPGEGYVAKYLYDVDVTGDDYTSGSPIRVLETGTFEGVERPSKWGGEVKNGEAHLTVTYKWYDNSGREVSEGTAGATRYAVSVEGYDSLPDNIKDDELQYKWVIPEDNLENFRTKNYAGQYRFPIYDEDKYLAGEGDVLITGAVFYLQSIKLLNCVNTGVYLFEQADVEGTRRYMHNEGTWQESGPVSYPSHFIYSPAAADVYKSDRQLTTLDEFDHRPVPCIQSGLKFPNSKRTLYSPTGDKIFGVYSILGYVGENTFASYNASNSYTGIHLEGVTNLGHYFSDAEQLETNDGNLRTRVTVEMKLCHSFGGGASNTRGHNMHFATVRNTVYRVYVKFYAKGTSLFVRYYFYDGTDNAFDEKEYEKADFYSLILEDDRYRPVVD